MLLSKTAHLPLSTGIGDGYRSIAAGRHPQSGRACRGAGGRSRALTAALGRVLLHIILLFMLALLLHHRSAAYFAQQRALAAAARAHAAGARGGLAAVAGGVGPGLNEEHLLAPRMVEYGASLTAAAAETAAAEAAAAGAAGTEPDLSWLPPPWVGEPEPLDPVACVPQMLIIGGMKCGTSSLFHYLNGTVPRPPQAARKPGAAWQPPSFGNDQVGNCIE
jgi:hypothetical protein